MTVNEYFEKFKEIKNSWIIAQLTDEYIVDIWPDMRNSTLSGKEEKILELRIFNNDMEYRLLRTGNGNNRKFDLRILCDSDDNHELEDSFDDLQYLDIDDTRTEKINNGYKVKTTGGGLYYLPIKNVEDNRSSFKDAKVRIRYYLDKYEETGQARVADWRFVELVNDD